MAMADDNVIVVPRSPGVAVIGNTQNQVAVVGQVNPTAVMVVIKKGNDGVDGTANVTLSLVNHEAFTVQAGQPIKIYDATHFVLAQGDTLANEARGVCNAQTASGQSGELMLIGLITRADWTSVCGVADLVTGSNYWVATGTPGILTTIAPETTGTGTLCQYVGFAISPRELYVQLARPLVL